MTDFARFYQTYDEDGRLRRHPTEFAVTTYILDPLIEAGDRVLDVGAGTGAYSLHLAARGCSVVAVDAVPRHVATLREKLESRPGLDVRAVVGDARDLSAFAGQGFDAVLCMGPVYHASWTDAEACLGGSLAALRPGGLLVVSYVTTFGGHDDDPYAAAIVHRSPDEIDDLLAPLGTTRLYHGPTDGPVFHGLDALAGDEVPLSALHAWLDRNQAVFAGDGWPDTSTHALYVGRAA